MAANPRATHAQCGKVLCVKYWHIFIWAIPVSKTIGFRKCIVSTLTVSNLNLDTILHITHTHTPRSYTPHTSHLTFHTPYTSYTKIKSPNLQVTFNATHHLPFFLPPTHPHPTRHRVALAHRLHHLLIAHPRRLVAMDTAGGGRPGLRHVHGRGGMRGKPGRARGPHLNSAAALDP